MTLQNLRYIIEVANCRSFSKAAQALFMTQSALSTAIRDTESELGIQIFMRTNRGVSLTAEGEDCLRYCKEIIERTDYLCNRYQKTTDLSTSFAVSCHHLPFAVRAFDELLSLLNSDCYDLAIRETETEHIMQDVSKRRSELGIVAFVPEQLELLKKPLALHGLIFIDIARLDAFVFLRKRHPLAERETLRLEELKTYPFVTFDQQDAPGFYTEECLFYKPIARNIHVTDRATKMSILRSTDAFSIGVDLPNFNQDIYFKHSATEMVAIPFEDQKEPIRIGYLVEKDHALSSTAAKFIALVEKHVNLLKLPQRAGKNTIQ